MNLSKGYLLVLVAVLLVLTGMLVAPILQYVLLAILLAYVFYPLQRRLAPRFGPRRTAGALLVVALVGFLIPLALALFVIADDAVRVLGALDLEGFDLEELESFIEGYAGVDADLAAAIQDSGQEVGMVVLERTVDILGTTMHVLVGLGLTLFLLYYLLADGDAFVSWIEEITPLPDDIQDDLIDELDGVMGAVVVGHLLIAIVQGSIAGLGLLATGVPNAEFWTLVMIVLALIPVVGAFLVWGPAAGYLLLMDRPIAAVGLFVYSAVVVSTTDDYLRPLVVDRYAQISPAVILLGVVGGVYAFGIMGLFFGPVLVGALKATLTVVSDHYDRLEADEDRIEPGDVGQMEPADEDGVDQGEEQGVPTDDDRVPTDDADRAPEAGDDRAGPSSPSATPDVKPDETG